MRTGILASLVSCCLLAALPAAAHGPTIDLSYDRVAPEKLAIRAGDTVHFHNASTTPRTFTVVAKDGTFESPPLARGEGWHHTFTEPGRHPYSVVEFPDMVGLVVVAPAEPESRP